MGGTGIITSCLSGMAVSGEAFGSPALGVLGLLLLTGFLILIARLNANSESAVRIRIHPAAPLTGILFGAYMVPLKPSGLTGIDFIPSMALGILLAGIALKLIVRPKVSPEARNWGIFSGLLWNGGNLLGLVAVKSLGLMIAYPLIQAALFIAILWGVVLYGELPAAPSEFASSSTPEASSPAPSSSASRDSYRKAFDGFLEPRNKLVPKFRSMHVPFGAGKTGVVN